MSDLLLQLEAYIQLRRQVMPLSLKFKTNSYSAYLCPGQHSAGQRGNHILIFVPLWRLERGETEL